MDSLPHLVEQAGRSHRWGVPGFIRQLIVRTQLHWVQFFDLSAVYVFSDRPGYLSRARLFVMTRTSKSSHA
jgi:hypothetical protein